MILTNTQYCIQTERLADCCEFPTVVSNSLAKTINKIVIAFAFSDSENGTATLFRQLFCVCVCYDSGKGGEEHFPTWGTTGQTAASGTAGVANKVQTMSGIGINK